MEKKDNHHNQGNYKFNNYFELIEGTSTKKQQPWYKRLLSRNRDALKFSKSEMKHIRKVANEQPDSSEPWIRVKEQSFPRPGYPFRVKKGTSYSFMPPGSLVFVTRTSICKEVFVDPEAGAEVSVLPLNCEAKLAEVNSYNIRVQDLEAVSEAELEDFIREKRQSSIDQDVLYDGEAVELAQDITRKMENPMQGAASFEFRKGLKGIIDSPKFRQGMSLSDINSPYQNRHRENVPVTLEVLSGRKIHSLLNDRFSIPLPQQGIRYSVYIPEYRTHLEFGRSELRRRSFDKEMFNRIVMSPETRESILSLVYGKDEDLRRWGLEEAFQKGRGEVFMAYGPPGTGKTMTGEALAELLERPLYIADSTNLSYDLKSFESGLNDIFEKTERWNSVTLIDEAEIILQSREAGLFDSSARVAIVLRSLEKLEKGILWLTTNRPIAIDFAIESRIRAQIYFPPFNEKQREMVWQRSLPSNIPIKPDVRTNDYLSQLASININGREIRNAIINAAKQASAEGLDHVPADYLLKWARIIPRHQKVLKKARSDGRQYGEIGFLKESSK